MRGTAFALARLALSSTLAIGLAGNIGCSTVATTIDPMAAMPRESPGKPVLSLWWKLVVADHREERKPQEFASPAVQPGVGSDVALYIGSHDGTFYSIGADRGRISWKVPLGSISSRPVVNLGRIYVGTDDGALICIDSLDGEEKWRYTTRGAVLESPVLAEDAVFFSNEADQVYALEQTTGKFRWQYKGDTPEEYTLRGHAGVAVDEGLVFTGFSSGTMVALRTNTGSVAWMTSLKGDAERFVDVDGTPVVSGDTVFITSSSGGLYAVDKATGLVRWRLPITNAGALTVDGDRLYVVAAEQGVYAVDRGGHIIWRQGTRGGGEFAEPLVSGDYLIYSLSEDGVFIADKLTGELYQYFDPGEGVSATPTLWNDRLYFLSNGGILYSMNVRRF